MKQELLDEVALRATARAAERSSKQELLAEFGVAPDNLPCLDEQVVAAVQNCSPEKLQRDRYLGQGLPYYKIGRLIRYKKADVMRWLETRRVAA